MFLSTSALPASRMANHRQATCRKSTAFNKLHVGLRLTHVQELLPSCIDCNDGNPNFALKFVCQIDERQVRAALYNCILSTLLRTVQRQLEPSQLRRRRPDMG